MKVIKDFLGAFGPGARLDVNVSWRREANGVAYAAYTVLLEVMNGAERRAALPPAAADAVHRAVRPRGVRRP